MPKIVVEHHPDVEPFTGFKRDGTTAPPDIVGMAVSIVKSPTPKPLDGIVARHRRKRR